MEQEQFVGLDVSQAETSVCVVDGARQRSCGRASVRPPRRRWRRPLSAPGLHAVRIALETGPMFRMALPPPYPLWASPSSASTRVMPKRRWRSG